MLKLRLLGRLALEKEGEQTTVSVQRKPFALLAVVAVAGEQGISREKVASYFWPESDTEHSRNALNQLLHHLRHRGLDGAVVGTNELRVDPAYLTSDVGVFVGALARSDFAAAIEAYGGPFLDGMYLRGVAEFERWVEDQRRRFAEQYAMALETMARGAADAHDYASAINWWRLLVRHAPLGSRGTLGLMRVLAASGDYGEALQVAHVHNSLVRSELDAEPAPEIRQLTEQLRVAAERRPGDEQQDRTQAQELTFSPNASSRAPQLRRRPLVSLAAATVLLLAVSLGTALAHGRSARNDGTRDAQLDSERIVVSTFDNLTRDSSLAFIGPLITEWVTEGLARTGVVSVARHSFELWSDDMHGQARDGQPRWLDAGRAARAGLVLHGGYARHGDTLRIDAMLVDASTGRVIQAIDPVGGAVADPMPVVDIVRQRLMSVIAARVNPELRQWIGAAGQPTSFEAYREYTEGMAAFADKRWPDAVVHFFQSGNDDANYTLPLLWAAFALENNGERMRADSLIRALEPRRESMAPLDRALHDYLKAPTARAQYEAASRLVELAPGSEFQWKLATAAYNVGKPREAIRLLQQMDFEKSWLKSINYIGLLAEAYATVGDYSAAQEATSRAAVQPGADAVALGSDAFIAAALGNAPRVRRRLTEMAGRGDQAKRGSSIEWAAFLSARNLRARGDTSNARQIEEWTLRFLDTSSVRKRLEHDSVVVIYGQWYRAFLLYDLGRLAESQSVSVRLSTFLDSKSDVARRALGENPNLRAVLLANLAAIAVRRNDLAAARDYRERILNSGPLPQLLDKYLLARIAALMGENDQAVRLLTEARGAWLGWVDYYRQDPDLVSLRAHPAFQALLRFDE